MGASRQHSEDTLAIKSLDLLRLPLLLRVAVAQPAVASMAPAPNSTAAGEGEAVVLSSLHGRSEFLVRS